MAASAIYATAIASSTVHGDVRWPATTSVNAWSSAPNAAVSRSMKKVAGGPAGQLDAGFEVAQRGGVAPAGCDAVTGAVQFQPDVVPAGVVPGVRHHRGGAVVEGQQRLRGGDIAELGEEVGALGAAGGVHLDDLAAGDPADRVEVVHAAVPEDAAGHLDVSARRRRRVQGGRPDGVHPAELAGLDRGAGGGECRVEAARVTDLHRHPLSLT